MLKALPDAPNILCKTESEFRIENYDRSKMVAFVMPELRCKNLVEKACLSLIESMPDDYPFGLIVIAGDQNDGTIEWCRENGIMCCGNHMTHDQWPWQTTGLCKQTYDAGIWKMLGRFDSEAAKFSGHDHFGYFCWLHTDMLFPQKGWIKKLTEIYARVPDVGIIGPFTDQYFGATEEFKIGNVAPWMVSVARMEQHYKKFGWFQPPEMWFCVDYDDWAMHQRFISLGTRSLVARDVSVIHPMMGTREILHKGDHSARDRAINENRDYYIRTYRTQDDPWNYQFGRRK